MSCPVKISFEEDNCSCSVDFTKKNVDKMKILLKRVIKLRYFF